MRKLLLTTAAVLGASFAVAAPAQANEGRAEAHGGIVWAYGASQATAGVALGYDWDLGSSAFVGVEASADKILEDGTKVSVGGAARLGIKAGEQTKVYVVGGVATKIADGLPETWTLGGGLQHDLGGVYIKAEYRHMFISTADADSIVGGIGVNF